MNGLRGVCAVVVLLAVTSCGPSDSQSTPFAEESATTSVTTNSTVPPTSGDASLGKSSATTVGSTTTIDDGAEPYFAGLEIALVSLLPVGEGARPVLTWEPMGGAADYTVLVLDPDGAPWWAWTGSDNSVVLGGVDTDAEIGGPRDIPGVTWIVFAYDDQGGLIGASQQEAIGQ